MPGPEIYWNSDSTRGVRIEFIGDVIQFYYSWKSDNLEQQQVWHKLCHIPCRDTKNQISRTKREGRRYVYWLSADYFLVASSINSVSYDSVFDLYYYSDSDSDSDSNSNSNSNSDMPSSDPDGNTNNNHMLGPIFIFSVPSESKSNHLRLCLVPELCRMEFNNYLSMRVNSVSGEIEMIESMKIQLVVGYDDKLSVRSGLNSRCFQRRVININ